ncbi:hypothetical protein HFN89_04830 [Rhizobium laguerreae]|nr:hypothetical protein [Rhizobium laguerreae]
MQKKCVIEPSYKWPSKIVDFWTVWDTTDSPPGFDVVNQYSGTWTREAIERSVGQDGYVIDLEPVEDAGADRVIASASRPPVFRF